MGILLLILVILGFGSALLTSQTNPASLPTLYHVHALIYLIWFLLFIFQARLINSNNRNLHKKLGYSSVVVVVVMLVTGIMMTSHSYDRGISPVPIVDIHQFLAFPLIDFLGLLIFFSLAFLTRHNALAHKHYMLLTSIVIMDPAIARLTASVGVPPAALLIHLGLVVLLMIHDRKANGKIHYATWFGLAWVILRVAFIFTIGATQIWADLMNTLFS